MTVLRYIAATTIAKVEQRYETRHKRGVGKDAEMEDIPTGWWVVTAAPWPYSFCVGSEKPDLKAGGPARLILEVGS